MYKYNSELFNGINKILGTSKKKIADLLGVAPCTIQWWINANNMPVNKLITLCNHYRIPISYFFVGENGDGNDDGNGNVEGNGNYNGYVVMDKPWITIEDKMANIGEDVCKKFKVGNSKAAVILDICHQSYTAFFGNGMTDNIKCQEFVKMCNNAKVYPGKYIIDLNRPIEIISELQENANTNLNANQEIEMLKKRVSALESELAELKRMFLEDRYDYVARAAED